MKHDQLFGGSFNAHKNWKKLREKHRANDAARKAGRRIINTPEVHSETSDEFQKEPDNKLIYDLRYDLAFGKITEEEFNKRMAELELE